MDATATTLRARDRTLASLFKQHDANDDGVLDLEEFAALLTAVDPQQYPAVEKGAGEGGDGGGGGGGEAGEGPPLVQRSVLLFYRQALDVQRKLFPPPPHPDDDEEKDDDDYGGDVHEYHEEEEEDALSPMAFILAARSMLHAAH